MGKYIIHYQVKRKGLLPLNANATEYAKDKKEIRERYKMYDGYKITKIEECEED